MVLKNNILFKFSILYEVINMSITWIKLSVNIFEDEKIQIIESMPEGPQMILVWIKLLALAGKINQEGIITLTENKAYTPEYLATLFRMPVEFVNHALETFQDFGMITTDENYKIIITHWTKYQNVEGMERIRQKERERKKLARERKKVLELTNDNMPETSEVSESTNKLGNNEQNLEEQNSPKMIKKKRICKTFEEYVELTENEHEKLIVKYGQETTARFIQKLSNYIGQNGKNKYKNHYYTLLNWIQNEEEKGKGGNNNGGNKQTSSNWIEKFKNPAGRNAEVTEFFTAQQNNSP